MGHHYPSRIKLHTLLIHNLEMRERDDSCTSHHLLIVYLHLEKNPPLGSIHHSYLTIYYNNFLVTFMQGWRDSSLPQNSDQYTTFLHPPLKNPARRDGGPTGTNFAIHQQLVSIKIKFKLSSSQEPSQCLFKRNK